MIRSNDLIEQAKALARIESGRPKEASLRRAVSAAYYAIFHELCRIIATSLASANAPPHIYASMYRVLEHRAARSFFDRLRRQDSDEFKLLGKDATTLAKVGFNFILLQNQRMTADYDPTSYGVRRTTVLEWIEQSSDSVSQLQGLSEATKRDLAVMIVTPKRK